MKISKNFYKQTWVQIALGLGTAILIYLALSHLNVLAGAISTVAAVTRPVLLGLVIAYVLHPLVNVFERKVFSRMKHFRPKTRHVFSVTATILVVLLLIVLLMIALIPQLIGSVVRFLQNAGDYIASLQKLIALAVDALRQNGRDVSNLSDMIKEGLDGLTNLLPSQPSQLLHFVTNIGVGVFDWVIGIIMAIYFLMDMERWMGGLRQLMGLLLSRQRYRELRDFAKRSDRILIRYIGGTILDGLIVAFANFIFMMIMQMPYAVLLSLVVGVTNLAPTFGPILGGAIGSLILLLINPWHALWFLIFTIILQTIDGYVIKPRLFGNTLGVAGIWILICIIVGGKAFGVIGILLAIPFAAISDFVYRESILVRLRHFRERRDAESGRKEGQEHARAISPEDPTTKVLDSTGEPLEADNTAP